MILHGLISFISIFFSVFMIASWGWMEIHEEEANVSISKYKKSIKAINKIENMNILLNKKLIPLINSLPESKDVADIKMIDFFDKHSKLFNFKVNKYVHGDDSLRLLNISFSLNTSDKKALTALISLRFKNGFIQFTNFFLSKYKLEGDLILIQPFFKGDDNVSK